MNTIYHRLNKKDWSNITPFILCCRDRSYLSAEFDYHLTKTLKNRRGLLCQLKANSNWFKKSGSRKQSLPFWSGTYSCKCPNCPAFYRFSIPEDPNTLSEFDLIETWEQNPNHSDYSVEKRCVGGERANLAVQMAADGQQNVRNQNILLNHANSSNGNKSGF